MSDDVRPGGTEDPEIHLSGPVPLADLSTANAVIDQERQKVHYLEQKLAESNRAYGILEQVNGNLRSEIGSWRIRRNSAFGLAAFMAFLFVVALVGLTRVAIQRDEHKDAAGMPMPVQQVSTPEMLPSSRCQFAGELVVASVWCLPNHPIKALRQWNCDCGETHYLTQFEDGSEGYRMITAGIYRELLAKRSDE